MNLKWLALVGVTVLVVVVSRHLDVEAKRLQASAPCAPVTATITADAPSEPCNEAPSSAMTSAAPIDVFDDFSWRMFVSLVWPADAAQRGLPDRSRTRPDEKGARVFEMFATDRETFAPDHANDGWADGFPFTGCSAAMPGDLILASTTSFGSLLRQGGKGVLADPLPTQWGTWVRYQTAFNRKAYETVREERLFDKFTLFLRTDEGDGSKIPGPHVQFDAGSVIIKSAWAEVPSELQGGYYTRPAVVSDSDTMDKCRRADVSLVGLHIITQTQNTSPYWIWSSFEHMDNVPPSSHTMAFNDGKAATPSTSTLKEYPDNPIDWNKPAKFNVERHADFPVAAETQNTNGDYIDLLKDTVWRNYRLVTTMWPGQINNRNIHDRLLPSSITPTAKANPVFETFAQGMSCMACHRHAADENFVWSLVTRVKSQKVEETDPILKKFTKTEIKIFTSEPKELKGLRDILGNVRSGKSQ